FEHDCGTLVNSHPRRKHEVTVYHQHRYLTEDWYYYQVAAHTKVSPLTDTNRPKKIILDDLSWTDGL
ncbi:unnamed protein product, partial [Rotaria magnacalcarata]